jgi:hypothetical protein
MQNFLDPAILFFVFGVLAGVVKSNLEIPRSIAKFLSLYLLMALGLKGGFALAHTGLTVSIAQSLGLAVMMAMIVPVLGYWFLKHRISRFDAAAISATYGSISAVTFVTTVQYLEGIGIEAGGHMAVAMVLMESPAIVIAVVLANMLRQKGPHPQALAVDPSGPSVGKILHESFTDGAHLLLIGSMVIGLLSGDAGKAVMQPFSGDLFKGMLAFFLLDMGLLVAKNFKEASKSAPVLLGYAALSPLVHAGIALALAAVVGLPVGDAVLLMVLSASASYIVVPAVLRYAIPEANPALYFGLSLGITFPVNIILGIPLYSALATRFVS